MNEPPGGAAATRTLPRDISLFTGRAHELDRLAPGAAAGRGAVAGGVVGIYAIGSQAGVGKTAFAVHAAYQLAARFPDRQLFLPLTSAADGPAAAAFSLSYSGLAAALIREYARARAAAREPVEADAAASRLVGYLEHTAATADSRLARHPRPDVTARYLPPAAAPPLDSYDQALAWLRAGRADLLACISLAAGRGLQARVVALTAGLSSLLRPRPRPRRAGCGRHCSSASASAPPRRPGWPPSWPAWA